jgi:hypothetical protein
MEETPAPYVPKEEVKFLTKEAATGETPKQIKYIYKALFTIHGVFTLFTQFYPNMLPTETKLHIHETFGFLDASVYFICQQFGWVPKKDNE